MRRFPVSFAMLQINHRLFFYPLDTTENCHGRQKRTAAKLTFYNSPNRRGFAAAKRIRPPPPKIASLRQKIGDFYFFTIIYSLFTKHTGDF